MSTSEKIYYIKNDELYRVIGSRLEKTDFNQNERYSLLIDDSYLFYLSIVGINASGRKLNNIINVSLASKMPFDSVIKRGYTKINNNIVVYIVSDKLINLIANNKNLFINADKISSPFIELMSRYTDFVFFDGNKYYSVKDSAISMSTGKGIEHITSANFIEEVTGLKNKLSLPTLKGKSKLANYPYIFPVVALLICYLLYIAGNLISLNSLNKVNDQYNKMLQGLYNELGVASNPDPYGMILYKARKNTSNIDGGKSIIGILEELSTDKVLDNVTIRSFNYRDKVVRVEGSTTDYATLEEFQKRMNGLLKQDITLSDVKKDNNRIQFSMRYNR